MYVLFHHSLRVSFTGSDVLFVKHFVTSAILNYHFLRTQTAISQSDVFTPFIMVIFLHHVFQ